MFRFFQKISKQVNKLNTFVNDYKSVAKEVSLPSYAYVNWGAQLAESGNEKDALEKFEQSAQMVNSTPEAFVNLGIIFARKGEFEQAIKYNLVKGETFFTDSTHKKANANKNKFHTEIRKEVIKRRKWLEEEINEERRTQGKKEFEFKDEIEEKQVKISNTDGESGYYHRDNKEKGFMYLDHRTVDSKCNIIVDSYVTKGNVHDSTPYVSRLEYIKEKFGFHIKEVGIDSGYDTLDIKKYLHDNKIFGVIAYRRYPKAETTVKKYTFKYIKESDCYVCPKTGVILEYTGRIDRNGYKYYASKENCSNCPEKEGCCNKKEYRVITRHIREDLNEEMRNNRLSERGKEMYKMRKEKVERSFADSKQNHGFRYAMYKGIEKNQNYTWLICAAQNMKNISIKLEKVMG